MQIYENIALINIKLINGMLCLMMLKRVNYLISKNILNKFILETLLSSNDLLSS